MARILLIDDEGNLRLMIRLALQHAGHTVETAADGPEGLAKFGEGAGWDLTLLDQRMPGMEGMEVLREIRRREPEAKVIMITAFGTIDLAGEAMERHCGTGRFVGIFLACGIVGGAAFMAFSALAGGVPGFDVLLGGALFILQSPREVTMIFSGNAEVRHILLNASYSANPKPSWYGESVGHCEGDTLVVDTIGLNDKTFLDNYRTPHTDKLHVTERWRLIEDGKKLEILITIDDPGTFNEPFQALRQYSRVNRALAEDACSENNINPFGIDYMTPVAEKPDF